MKKKSTTATFDPDTPITQADIDAGALIPRKRVAGRAVMPKKRVTLYLDAALVDEFKRMAGARGYQTIINETLKTSLSQTSLEGVLRRVIREELKRA
jgi:uncharacterized protein (DUF4415 family)